MATVSDGAANKCNEGTAKADPIIVCGRVNFHNTTGKDGFDTAAVNGGMNVAEETVAFGVAVVASWGSSSSSEEGIRSMEDVRLDDDDGVAAVMERIKGDVTPLHRYFVTHTGGSFWLASDKGRGAKSDSGGTPLVCVNPCTCGSPHKSVKPVN